MFDDKINLLHIYAHLPNTYRFCPTKFANIIFPPTCLCSQIFAVHGFFRNLLHPCKFKCVMSSDFLQCEFCLTMIFAANVDWSNIKVKTKHVTRNRKQSLWTWADTRPRMSTWILSQSWGRLVELTRPSLLNKLRWLDSLAMHLAHPCPIKFLVAH